MRSDVGDATAAAAAVGDLIPRGRIRARVGVAAAWMNGSRYEAEHSSTALAPPSAPSNSPRSHGPPPPLTLPPSLFSQLRVLKEILLFAPLLGRSRTLPPYDGLEKKHADDRRDALEQMANRCSADGALQLLCSDAAVSGGAFAFAPLRAVDLNAN